MMMINLQPASNFGVSLNILANFTRFNPDGTNIKLVQYGSNFAEFTKIKNEQVVKDKIVDCV